MTTKSYTKNYTVVGHDDYSTQSYVEYVTADSIEDAIWLFQQTCGDASAVDAIFEGLHANLLTKEDK